MSNSGKMIKKATIGGLFSSEETVMGLLNDIKTKYDIVPPGCTWIAPPGSAYMTDSEMDIEFALLSKQLGKQLKK